MLRIELSQSTSEKIQWRSRLSQWPGVEITHHSGDRDSRCRVLCRFLIPDPTSPTSASRPVYYRRSEMRLQHDDRGGVWLCCGDQADQEFSASVASIDQIDQFVRLVLKHYHHQAALRRKRERVRDLRLRAIKARLGQWALQSEFTWYLRMDDETVDVAVARQAHRRVVEGIAIDHFESQSQAIRAVLASSTGAETPTRNLPDAEWNRWVETAIVIGPAPSVESVRSRQTIHPTGR